MTLCEKLWYRRIHELKHIDNIQSQRFGFATSVERTAVAFHQKKTPSKPHLQRSSQCCGSLPCELRFSYAFLSVWQDATSQVYTYGILGDIQ